MNKFNLAWLGCIFLGISSAAGQIDLDGIGDIYAFDPPAFQRDGSKYEQFVGDNELEPLDSLSAISFERKLATPVGRIRIAYDLLGQEQRGHCTGMILSQNYVLTNRHCYELAGDNIPNGTTPLEMKIDFGYLRLGFEREAETFDLQLPPKELGLGIHDDYAIFETTRPIPAKWGQVKLDDTIPSDLQSLVVVGHPQGLPALLSRGNCKATTDAVRDNGQRIFHECDTAPGSSGSPIYLQISDGFDTRTRVVAIHHAAAGRHNAGVLVRHLATVSPLIRNMLTGESSLVTTTAFDCRGEMRLASQLMSDDQRLLAYQEIVSNCADQPVAQEAARQIGQISRSSLATSAPVNEQTASATSKVLEDEAAARLLEELRLAELAEQERLRQVAETNKLAEAQARANEAQTARLNAVLNAGSLTNETNHDRLQARVEACQALEIGDFGQDDQGWVSIANCGDALIRWTQAELRRVGCEPNGIDGVFGNGMTSALRNAANSGKLTLDDNANSFVSKLPSRPNFSDPWNNETASTINFIAVSLSEVSEQVCATPIPVIETRSTPEINVIPNGASESNVDKLEYCFEYNDWGTITMTGCGIVVNEDGRWRSEGSPTYRDSGSRLYLNFQETRVTGRYTRTSSSKVFLTNGPVIYQSGYTVELSGAGTTDEGTITFK